MLSIVLNKLTALEKLKRPILAPPGLSVLTSWISGKGLDDVILNLHDSISKAIELNKTETKHDHSVLLLYPRGLAWLWPKGVAEVLNWVHKGGNSLES